MKPDLHTHDQDSAYGSPWSLSARIRQLFWEYTWALFCVWTPKPLNPWRLLVLRLFGARFQGTPFVHQRARIQQPWNLEMQHRACLGDRANAYTLGKIVIEEEATIAQEAYLCTGTHDFDDPMRPLKTGTIRIGARTFVGARALVMPGLTIGRDCIIGAASVVTKDIPDNSVVAGNPAKVIKTRASVA